jgi:hypothetical protein
MVVVSGKAQEELVIEMKRDDDVIAGDSGS